MENQRKRCVKRRKQRKDIKHIEAKRFLLAPCIDESVVTTTKITHVNTDCLESIFELLSLEDLLNVTDTSKVFWPAVEIVYRRQYGKEAAHTILCTQAHKPNKMIIEKTHHIQIIDQKIVLQQLRLFGGLIKSLDVQCNEKIKYCKYIYSYINKYCNQNLVRVRFIGKIPNVTMFKKPFLSVDKVSFDSTYLGGQITQFNKWFPKMRSMDFENVVLTDPKSIEINFKSLNHIKLCVTIPRESIENTFKLNPQLRELDFYSDFTGNLLEVASESLKNLEWLCVRWLNVNENENHGLIPNINGEKIYFNHLKTLQISLDFSSIIQLFKVNPFPQIPLTFGPVTEFHITSWCDYGVAKFLEFLSRHSTITHLFTSLHWPGILNVDMPTFLREITLSDMFFELSDGIDFMNRHTFIRKLGCTHFLNENNAELVSDIGTFELDNIIVSGEPFSILKRVN